MRAGSRNPLANSLNDRPFSNIQFSRIENGLYINRGATGNPRDLTTPDPVMYGEQNSQPQNQLTVPNQDIPLGDMLGKSGFQSDSVFTALDGTVFDLRSKRILFNPNRPGSGYWGDPSKTISMDKKENQGGAAMASDLASAEYDKNAKAKSAEMVKNMTDSQKDALAEFESHFPESKFEDD